MELSEIAGLLLVVAGIAWMFLTQFWSRTARSRGGAVDGVTKLIPKLLDWASKNLPRRLLPGVFLIVLGIVMFLLP